ncbi:MAG: LOG family protein, partial [Planctomycetota bacterium]
MNSRALGDELPDEQPAASGESLQVPKDAVPGDLPGDAIGDDELLRPQPIDDPVEEQPISDNADLYQQLRDAVDRCQRDQMARGDLKILSRSLRELRYAFKVFRPYRRRRKVTIFGSARTPSDHPDYIQTVDFAERMASLGWMVITGAGGGIMEAGHVGAGRDASMGLNIMLPFEQSSNPVIEGSDKLVTLKYFFTRKLMFLKECSGIVCAPGGFGTLDETMEVLTLVQTGKQTMSPIVLLDRPGGDYWKDLGTYINKHLLDSGMISPADVNLYRITDSVDVAVQEICKFYRVYHSMRYVKDELVLRLKKTLTEDQLQQLNDGFADILAKGAIRQSSALPSESGEPELAALPRLVMSFNRRALSRLRQLI